MDGWDDEQVDWIDAARKVGTLYAVQDAGRPCQGGFGHGGGLTEDDATFSAHVRQVDGGRAYDVEVDTDDSWPEDLDEWRLLSTWVGEAVAGPGSIVWPFEVRAERWTATVAVDGAPREFVVVGGPERWCAAARVDGRSVQLSGYGGAPLPAALVPVAPDAVSDDVPEEPGAPSQP